MGFFILCIFQKNNTLIDQLEIPAREWRGASAQSGAPRRPERRPADGASAQALPNATSALGCSRCSSTSSEKKIF